MIEHNCKDCGVRLSLAGDIGLAGLEMVDSLLFPGRYRKRPFVVCHRCKKKTNYHQQERVIVLWDEL
jgi:hypothetical protein